VIAEASTTIEKLMQRRIVTISPDETLGHVRELFQAHRFHHLLVVENRRLVGVISDRDLLRNLSPFVGNALNERTQDVATLNRKAHQIMTRRIVSGTADMKLADAINLILEHGVSCIPILDGAGEPIGILSWRDILRGLVSGGGEGETGHRELQV